MSGLESYGDRLFVKLEMNNPGGSHKFRAADRIVRCAIERGDIVPGKTTVIEKTGGNFGFGLLASCYQHNVQVDLAIGLGFSPVKRKLLESFGARLIGIDMLENGKTPREVVEHYLAIQAQLGRHYYYTDQFNNADGVTAHRCSTGRELVDQLVNQRVGRKVLFVGGAGTGASFTGITQALNEHGFDVETVLVEPAECDSRNGVFADHRLEGMAVGVMPPFLDWSLVNEVCSVTLDEMLAAQRHFYMNNGLYLGNTSAACFAVARQLLERPEHADRAIVTLAYDSGLWYSDIMENASKAA
ncbi:MAG: pyridoxal-phosphate dependent enzyme [Marinobacter sp.]|nr:pyridoxal-phosphate dependent enzyme [Marinobacter sp.]